MKKLSIISILIGGVFLLAFGQNKKDSQLQQSPNKNGMMGNSPIGKFEMKYTLSNANRNFISQDSKGFQSIPDNRLMAMKQQKRFSYLTTDDSIQSLVNHPAFMGFVQHLLPRNTDMNRTDIKLAHVKVLMPYHSHVNSATVVNALNYMIDEVADGKIIFYDFYTDSQKQEDPDTKTTGLFLSGENRELPSQSFAPEEDLPMSAPCMKGFPMPWNSAKKDTMPLC
jgi:hypothetical protein